MNTDRIETKTLLRAPLSRVWSAISDSTQFGTWFGMKFNGPCSGSQYEVRPRAHHGRRRNRHRPKTVRRTAV
jgi:uncharacterized protein YndB with AHSA1/START domain